METIFIDDNNNYILIETKVLMEKGETLRDSEIKKEIKVLTNG